MDAAVAAASALGVVEPYSSGIGGGGFMLIKTKSGTRTMIDGREVAPAAFTDRTFLDPATQQPLPFDEAVTSGLGVGVPGTPATWQAALGRFGTMQLRRLLKPSIRLARDGFEVDKTLQRQTEANADRFADFPATANIYLPGGEPIQAGSVLKNPGLARTLALMGRQGVQRGFYRGRVAQQILDTVRAPKVRAGTTRNVRPGLMTAADLRAYRVQRRAPTVSQLRGKETYGGSPPSSGGTTVGEILNIMEAFGPPTTDATMYFHREIEAERLAYADRAKYLGDPAFVSVPVDCLLSQPFATARAGLIGPMAATSPVAAGDCGAPPAARDADGTEGPNTTHLSVVDGNGMVVSYTFTIEQTGGSAMVVPRRGFLLNNELTDFTFAPGTANSPAARKRPRSSIAPTIVSMPRGRLLTVGSPGGSTIITTVAQVLLNRFERGMTLGQAIADPRVSEQNSSTNLTQAEPAFIDGPVGTALGALGHKFTVPTDPEIGAATGVEVGRRGKMTAAAEPERRGGGSAMVVGRTRADAGIQQFCAQNPGACRGK